MAIPLATNTINVTISKIIEKRVLLSIHMHHSIFMFLFFTTYHTHLNLIFP